MIETIEEWLEAKHVEMWADWYICDEGRRHKAAVWFAAELKDFNAYLQKTGKVDG